MSETKGRADRIHIRGLSVRCIIGLNGDERREKQDLVIDVTLETDLRRAASTDDVEHTVNYKTVNKRIIALVEESSFQLIEVLADRIARSCLEHAGVTRARVTVDKPGALRFTESVAVQIERTRDDYR